MQKVPYIPESAPFSPDQRAWLNGWLAGLFANGDAGAAPSGTPTPAPSSPAEPLLVMYGSQSGTAESLAKDLAKQARIHGFEPRVLELNAFSSLDLAAERRLALITSTWGDGDPPDNASEFWDFIQSDDAPKLEQLNFSVLALGDSNYEEFCGAGKKFDERLEALGARRIRPRVDCDLDYEEPAQAWMDSVWNAFKKVEATPGTNGATSRSAESRPPRDSARSDTTSEPNGANGSTSRSAEHCSARSETTPGTNGANGDSSAATLLEEQTSLPATAEPDTPTWNRKNPFPASLLVNRTLNTPDSRKDTRHFEIGLKDSGLEYEVGDALGVQPANWPELVAATISILDCSPDESVPGPDNKTVPLHEALLRHFEIAAPPRSLITEIAKRSGSADLARLLETGNKDELNDYLWGREIIDLLTEHPQAKFSAAEFVGCLRKLQPRLYSISSSPKAHPGEVHLTVAIVCYQSHGRPRKGVCSTFLAERVAHDTPLPVFVQPSHGFKLPEDTARPVIMVGPGTGIAPFRAFLEERRITGARGANWLFFGDRRSEHDFLYSDELGALQKDGTLHRLDTAFSRDRKEKVYVQHRMIEQAASLWQWLEDGAHFYVCGDAKRMAKDVDAALHEVIRTAGGKSAEDAAAYVARLKKEKRYQRDVY